LGWPGVKLPCGTLTFRMTLKTSATAGRVSPDCLVALMSKLTKTNRQAEWFGLGSMTVPLMSFQQASSASCFSKIGELVKNCW